MKMKTVVQVLIIFILAVLLSNCKSFDRSLLSKKEFIDKSVPSLHVVVNMKSIESCFPGNSISQNEIVEVINNNLSFKETASNIYLSVIIRKVECDKTHAWALTGASLGILNILGVPMDSTTYNIYLEAAVLNKNGDILKIYSATGHDTEYQALGWGYFLSDSIKQAYIQAIRAACSEISEQMKKDAKNIRKIIGER